MRGLVVGFGSIGKRHLRNLRQILPDAELTVVRHRPDAAMEPELELADRVVFRLEDALDNSPEFAIICSPAPFHVPTALTLAQAGVHLLMEKPLSDHIDGVDELLSLCRHKDLVLLVGYFLRFSPPLQTVQRAVAEGQIGRLVGFDATVGQYLPEWRANVPYRESLSARPEMGGGVLLELSHELDCARWIAGEVSSLSAFTGRVSDLDLDVEDWADMVVEFRSGAIGHIHLDMVQRTPFRGGRAIGTDGTITWEVLSNHVRLYSAATHQWEDLHPAGALDRNDMYLDEIEHFIDCIRGDASPSVTGLDGKRALEMALAARQSSLTRKAIPV